MAKHTQTILPTNCLSVLGHFVGLALKELTKNGYSSHEKDTDYDCGVNFRYSLPSFGLKFILTNLISDTQLFLYSKLQIFGSEFCSRDSVSRFNSSFCYW